MIALRTEYVFHTSVMIKGNTSHFSLLIFYPCIFLGKFQIEETFFSLNANFRQSLQLVEKQTSKYFQLDF